jgi:hypothetical protein
MENRSANMKAVDLRWDSDRRCLAFTAVQRGDEFACRISFEALERLANSSGSADAKALISIFLYNEARILAIVQRRLAEANGGMIDIRGDDLPRE